MDDVKDLSRREFTVRSALAILGGVAITVSACSGDDGSPISPSTMPGDGNRPSPQILLATIDRDEELVEVPRVAKPTAPVPESSGVGTTEGATPLPNGLVGDRHAAVREEVFDIPETQAEAKVEPAAWAMMSAGNRYP